jgi:limonene-1,2-epoxide hydrolase
VAEDINPEELEQGNLAVVTAFCQSWEAKDMDGMLSCLDDRIFYQMWDADDAIKVEGKEQFAETVGDFIENMDTVEFEIIRSQAMGKIVINERTDRFINEDGQMIFSITGVFSLENGKIVHWKDYLFPGKIMESPF